MNHARIVRNPFLTCFAAVLLSTAIVCAPGVAYAATSDGAKARSGAGAVAPVPDAAGDEALEDLHPANTELGRAIAGMRKDPRKAAADFGKLHEKMPWLDDVTDFYAATARSRFDRPAARKDFEEFLTKYPDSVLRGDAAAELARLVAEDADVERAVSLAERYGRSGPDTGDAASVCLSAGRVLAAKDPDNAAVYLQCARSKSPLSASARSAYELLTTLRRDHPELRPSGADGLMAEARLLGREGRSEEQAALLRELLDDFPGSPVEGEAELAYGRNLGRSESKAAGAAFFEKRAAPAIGAHKAKLLYEAATLRWNNDQNAEATELFEKMLGMKTGIGDEQQALYALARINDVEDHHAEAIAYYGRAAALAKGATRAESQWRQGWVSYRAKDYSEAAKTFAAMAAGAPRGSDTEGRADALYWQGRSLEHLGRNDEARECYRQVLSEFPLGYYAAASEAQLGRKNPAPTEIKPPVVPESLPADAVLAIRRATSLRESGLVTLAARDLSMRLARFDTATRRAVLPALPSSGAYDAAFRIAIEMNDAGELSREEARPYFYPRAHADIVERESAKAGIDPMLVYSLMRQESAFSATAVSSAKALGLMQLLEKTAKRVASSSGLPQPDADDLFDPAVNIRIAVRYLAELSKEFGGNTALIAAAYNAGETAAERWRDLTKIWQEDEMIEQISYRETRLYVKSILRNMRNYRSIYGSSPEAPVAKAS
ncbi:MAG TPA: transglycosylase SLT domain-containing protein [Candidatus Limnocylindrales bacterium]|nr:transglycosylase SLT domain-containing protein [Candidatus Limnocylindrales bacterium]